MQYKTKETRTKEKEKEVKKQKTKNKKMSNRNQKNEKRNMIIAAVVGGILGIFALLVSWFYMMSDTHTIGIFGKIFIAPLHISSFIADNILPDPSPTGICDIYCIFIQILALIIAVSTYTLITVLTFKLFKKLRK